MGYLEQRRFDSTESPSLMLVNVDDGQESVVYRIMQSTTERYDRAILYHLAREPMTWRVIESKFVTSGSESEWLSRSIERLKNNHLIDHIDTDANYCITDESLKEFLFNLDLNSPKARLVLGLSDWVFNSTANRCHVICP